jgi:hypothetical protein
MPYNEVILFPNAVDSFPSLRDNTGGAIKEDQIVYAEHYNKIANFIQVLEPKLFSTRTASGDTTLRAISHNFHISLKVSTVFALNAAGAFNTAGTVLPGNVLPFEFVFTTSNSNYGGWTYPGASSDRTWYQDTNASNFKNTLVGGLDIFNIFPMATATIISANNAAAPLTQPFSPIPDYHVNCYAVKNTNTLMIRGAIIDVNAPQNPPANSAERWISLGNNIILYCTIFGVV